jgi:hypothetical protein
VEIGGAAGSRQAAWRLRRQHRCRRPVHAEQGRCRQLLDADLALGEDELATLSIAVTELVEPTLAQAHLVDELETPVVRLESRHHDQRGLVSSPREEELATALVDHGLPSDFEGGLLWGGEQLRLRGGHRSGTRRGTSRQQQEGDSKQPSAGAAGARR